MANQPILYSYFRSSCAYRVRIVLALKKIEFEYRSVNLIKDGGEQNTEQYKQLNPFSFVPALIVTRDNGTQETLFESMAIIDYLEQTYPKPSVYPSDRIDRAQSIAIAESIVSGIQPLQNLIVLNKVEQLGGDKMAWAKDIITAKFESLERILGKTCGKYCVKDTITIADICLVPQVANAVRFAVDLDKFPIINRINKQLEEEEAFKAAHPSVQPDAPK